MKFLEAIQKLKEGYKIKRPRHSFSFTTDEGHQIYSSPISVEDLSSNDWEIFPETVKTYTF